MSHDLSSFISTRQVGNAEIAQWCEGIFSMASVPLNVPEETWQPAVPEVANAGELTRAVITTVVRLGGAIIVIDPAFDDPDSRLGAAMRDQFTGWTWSPGLQVGLDALGIANVQVTHVVITHAHFDHCLGVTVENDGIYQPRFPNARYFLQVAEWQRQPDPASPPPSPEGDFLALTEYYHQAEMWPRLRAIHEAGLLEFVEDELTIAPGVAILHTPAETSGHSIVRISSNGAVFYHLGDLVRFGFDVEHPGWVFLPFSDVAETMESTRRRQIPAIAEEKAVAVYTHAPFPTWGRIVPHKSWYRWESI